MTIGPPVPVNVTPAAALTTPPSGAPDNRIASLAAPTPLVPVQGDHAGNTLLSAAELGQQAARTRERATMTGDVKLAWDASAAASGSIMMLAQGRQQVEIVSRPPELR